MNGPLHGLRLIEIAGLGPAPFAAMMLADHGAEVIRIERPGSDPDSSDPLLRSRSVLHLDLKSPDDRARLRDLVKTADGLVEGFRPGVMERLGLNINYIAVSGALHMIGPKDAKPAIPLNLVGDFGGGGMMLAFGMVSALLAVKNGAKGQVVDCAMTDGSALLTAMMWGFAHKGFWQDQRGSNILDGAAPFYDVFETSDGQHMAVGAIEPQFYAALLSGLGLTDDPLMAIQMDISLWPAQKARIAQVFATRTRSEWTAVFDPVDACVTPVLGMQDALAAPHNRQRQTFIEVGGVTQPAPAPRYSKTPCAVPQPPRLKS